MSAQSIPLKQKDSNHHNKLSKAYGLSSISPILSFSSFGFTDGSLDVQGNDTTAFIDLGNPIPSHTNGTLPCLRLKSNCTSKTAEIQKIYGGDNNVYKHIEFNGRHTAIHDCYPGNAEIARFMQNGLTFNGDTAAANAIDDYEEGEWTPVVSDAGSGTVYTFSTHYEFRSNSSSTNQKVSYTKIGRMVYLCFSIYFNASINKRFRITLPFSYTGSNYQIGFTPTMYTINMSGDTLGTLGALGSKFDIFRVTNATSTGGHSSVPVSASTEMYFNFHYEAS